MLDSHSSAWGGDGNGRKDYPCRLSGFVFDRPQKGFAGSGSLWIDDVAIVKPRKVESGALEVKTKAWITEIGYPTHVTSRGSDPAAQARHCVRTLVLLQSTGAVEKVFWYDLKDDGLQREYNEHNFGLIHHQQFNCAPKPGIVAMSVFIRMTGEAQFQGLKQSGDSYAAHYRRNDGRDVIVAWTSQGSARLDLEGEVETVLDIMGGESESATGVELTQTPVYILGKDLGSRDLLLN